MKSFVFGGCFYAFVVVFLGEEWQSMKSRSFVKGSVHIDVAYRVNKKPQTHEM